MLIVDQITAQGRQLFRLRSFMPLILLPALYFALLQMANFEQRWGDEVEDAWLVVCALFSLVGLLIRCLTVGFVPVGTSGRGRGVPSAATLNTLGMYSIVRNPLYLANGLMWLGVALATTSAWFVCLSVLFYWLYIERVIAAEEAFLAERFGENFVRWASRTPCFLPRISQWSNPSMSFSVRTVLRREHSGLIAIGMAFTLIEFISDTWLEGEPVRSWVVTDREWVYFFCATVVLGLFLQLLKKCRYLDVAGR